MKKKPRSSTSLSFAAFFVNSKSAIDGDVSGDRVLTPRQPHFNALSWDAGFMSYDERQLWLRHFDEHIKAKRQGIFRPQILEGCSQHRCFIAPEGMIQYGLYLLGSELGRGAGGVVYHAQDLISGARIAIKSIKTQGFPAERVFPEKRSLAALGRLIGHANEQPHDIEHETVHLLMPLYQGKSLTAYLYEFRQSTRVAQAGLFGNKTSLTVEQKHALMLGIVKELAYIHERGILHRDLKSDNIIITEHDGQFKVNILDFDEACGLKSHPQDGLHGTFGYQAPELNAKKQDYSYASDVYACGILLAQICSRFSYPEACQRVMHDLQQQGFVKPMTHEQVRDALPDVLRVRFNRIADPRQRAVYALVNQMLATDAQKRPTAASACTKLNRILNGGILQRSSSHDTLAKYMA